MINFSHKNFNVDNFAASAAVSLDKAGKTLEKTGKKIEKFASQLPSKAESLANKIQNFNDNDLKKLGKKLEKYSDKAVAKMKKVATSMLHKLDGMTGGAIKGFCKDMNLPFPQKSASGQMKDFGKELLGEENFKRLTKFGNEVKSEFNELKSFVNDDLKSGANELAAQIKARYRS